MTTARRFFTFDKLVLIRVIAFVAILYGMTGGMAVTSVFADPKTQDTQAAVKTAGDMAALLEAGNMTQAYGEFTELKKWWNANKPELKKQSLDMASEIDREIASLSLAFLNKDAKQASQTAGTFQFSLKSYADGAFTDNTGKSEMTLGTYVMKLRQAADLMEKQEWQSAGDAVKLLQRQWLIVEGDVVSQSQAKYDNAERDLVLMDAYLASADKQTQALPVANRLIDSLEPLVGAQYSWWDAALIPLREGLESLLVVGALLMYAKKAGSTAAKRWVIGGSSAAIAVCVAIGFVVAFVLSSSTFGRNNSLINGWTGVFASLMLLYVSYWLHRNSDIKRWNKFLQTKSSEAVTSGRMISLALLAFFAIVREGLETVIFLIGMAGKMPAMELAAGIATGFGLLVVLALAIIKGGAKLPVKPVFLVSSIIVFYLCFKFMGSGIHSLQMAGVIPSSVQEYLPERASISLYPSWYSTLPQFLFVAAAMAVVLYQKMSIRGKTT